ncbi:MAG: MATE family efflux transporter [Oscillospiraceae bacterium]|nr:MATE family efflux transporter [Oscillospiraceae bacterium]
MDRSARLGEFLRYAIFQTLGMLGLSCYILADTYFVANRLGAQGLAALNLAIPVYSFIHGCGLMLGMGGATAFSVLQAQGEQRRARRLFSCTLCLAGGFALVFVLFGLFAADPIAALLGAGEDVFEMARSYLTVLLLFSPAFLANDVLLCFVRNDGNPGLAMASMLAGSLLNILLDYLFLYSLQLGIFGAALATGASPVAGLFLLAFHRRSKTNTLRLLAPAPLGEALRSILSLGLPSLVAEFSSGLVIVAFNRIISGLEGSVGVAAYGVVANLSLVVMAVFTGVAQGAQPLLSRAHGRGEKKAAGQVFFYAACTLLLLSAGLYAALFCFSGPLVGLFNGEGSPRLQELAVSGLRFYFSGLFFAAFNLLACAFLPSVEKAAPAHWISLLRGILLILPAAWGLSRLARMTGVWLAFPLTDAAVFLLSVFFCRRELRRAPS